MELASFFQSHLRQRGEGDKEGKPGRIRRDVQIEFRDTVHEQPANSNGSPKLEPAALLPKPRIQTAKA